MNKRYQVFVSSTYSDLEEERQKVIQTLMKMDCIPAGKSENDPEIKVRLARFKEKVKKGRLVLFWSNASELPGIVALSLQNTIKMFPAVGWIRANLIPDNIYKEFHDLKKRNEEFKKRLNLIPPNSVDESNGTSSEVYISDEANKVFRLLQNHQLKIGNEKVNLVKVLYALGDTLNGGLVAASAWYNRAVKNIVKVLNPALNSELIECLETEDPYDNLDEKKLSTDNLISPLIMYDIVERITSNDMGVHSEYWLSDLGNEILKYIHLSGMFTP